MRYASAFLYSLALAGHIGLLLPALMEGACVGIGTLCAIFAVEGIVRHEIWKAMGK